METFLTKDDFNLQKEHEMFDVLYSVDKQNLTEIKEWCVIGHRLSISADKRKYDYILIPHPISIYVMKNVGVNLSTLRNEGHFVGKTKEDVIKQAKLMINEMFQNKLDALAKISKI